MIALFIRSCKSPMIRIQISIYTISSYFMFLTKGCQQDNHRFHTPSINSFQTYLKNKVILLFIIENK